MKKIGLVVIGLVLILGIGLRVYQKVKGKVFEEEKEEVFLVKTGLVEKGKIEKTLSLSGDIAPFSEITIFSKVAGTVEKIYVDIGDRVKKCQVLVRIDDKEIRLQLISIKESLRQAEVNLTNIEKNYERMRELFSQEVITPQEMDNITAQKEAAFARVEQLKAQVDLVKEKLADTIISSPMNGIVIQRFIDPGELTTDASMAKNAPLLTINNLDSVKVKVAVGEKDLGEIKVGQLVRVKVDAFPARTFSCKINKIAPLVDPLSRTTELEIKVNNRDYLLKKGMFARVEIIVQKKDDALLIPSEALFAKQDKEAVFVIRDNQAYLQQVETGLKNPEKVEIAKGLSEGEEVVTVGLQRLKDGVKVKVVR